MIDQSILLRNEMPPRGGALGEGGWVVPTGKKISKREINKFLFFLSFFLTVPFGFLYAQATQRVEIASSPNPVGSGARALGMGGAFIAVATDATAASWNPGGLIQVEKPEASLVWGAYSRQEKNDFQGYPEANGLEDANKNALNYFSATQQFRLLEKNMVVSLNYQHLFDFTRVWDFTLVEGADRWDVDHDQHGMLSAYGLALAIEIEESLSLGGTLNLWQTGPRNRWEQTTQVAFTGQTRNGKTFSFDSFRQDRYSFQGANFNLGVLWDFSPAFSLGAIYKSSFTASLEREFDSRIDVRFPDRPALGSSSKQKTHEQEEMNMPASYGIGLLFHPSDFWAFALDLYQTEWGQFILTDSKGRKFSSVSGLPEEESEIRSTIQIRAGTEHFLPLFSSKLFLRGGAFYDPAPAEKTTDSYYGVSLGVGYLESIFHVDLAYQYRMGRDVGSSLVSGDGFSQDVDEHSLYSSLVLHL